MAEREEVREVLAQMRGMGTRGPLVLWVVAAALVLTGCRGLDAAFEQELVLTSADDYLTQQRSSLVPTVSADATKREGILTVGLRDTQAAPFVMEADTGGEASHAVDGLEVDLACQLADELGLRVGFVYVSDVGAALATNCDIVMGVSPFEASGFEVQGDYAHISTALFRHGSDDALATAEQVRSARIAVQEGSAAQQRLQRLGLEAALVPCDTLADAFEALGNGDVDFTACNSAAGSYYRAMRGSTSLAGLIDAPTSYGYAVAPNASELEGVLFEAYMRISNNGLRDEMLRTWLGTSEALGEDQIIAGLSEPEEAVAGTDGAQTDGAQGQASDGSTQVATEDSADTEASGDGRGEGGDGLGESPDAPSVGTSTETEVTAGANAATL